LASESDAQVIERTRIARVELDGTSVRLSASSGSSVVADRVLLALNAGLPRLLPELAPAVRPVRAQMLATAPLPPRLPAPVYSHEGYFYVRQRADGRVLVGGARHLHREAEVGYEDATTDMVQTDLERYLERHVGLCDVEIERRWSGTMGFSPDELPALGVVPGVPGAFWAAGFTGHGMGYGLRFGLLAARHVLGVGDAALDLFEAGRLTSV
ncbi:MAG: FAD-binding oxidoreductase, partial [Bacteroidota bacterium]